MTKRIKNCYALDVLDLLAPPFPSREKVERISMIFLKGKRWKRKPWTNQHAKTYLQNIIIQKMNKFTPVRAKFFEVII